MPMSAMSDEVRPDHRIAAKQDLAGGRLVDAGQHVHHRALARAVRADQSVDGAALDDEVDVVERLQAAELHQHAGRVDSMSRRTRRRGTDGIRRPSVLASALSASSVGRDFRFSASPHEADDAVLQVVDDEQRDQAEDRQPPVGHPGQHERQAGERDAAHDRDRDLVQRRACRARKRPPSRSESAPRSSTET